MNLKKVFFLNKLRNNVLNLFKTKIIFQKPELYSNQKSTYHTISFHISQNCIARIYGISAEILQEIRNPIENGIRRRNAQRGNKKCRCIAQRSKKWKNIAITKMYV